MSTDSLNQYVEGFEKLYFDYNYKLNQIADNFSKYKIYPTNKAYLTNYNLYINDLVKLENTILSNKNQLEDINNKIQEKINKFNNKLIKLTKVNVKLLKIFNALDNQDNAIEGELADKKFTYNVIYTRNIILLLIFIGCGINGIYQYKLNL